MSPQAQPPIDGRTARKHEAMRRVQAAAIEAFERRGYEAVTVEEVARAAGVGVASAFRNFGTKEQLVLWDEYDPVLFERLARHLAEGESPADALLAALLDALPAIYAKDRTRILRRADLVAKTPALAAAARLNVHLLREGLEALLKKPVPAPLARAVTAACLASTLEVAVEEWRRLRGRTPLEAVLRQAFRDLRALE